MEPSAHKLWCNDEIACAYVTYGTSEREFALHRCWACDHLMRLISPIINFLSFFQPISLNSFKLLCVLIEFIAPIVAVVNMRIIPASLISMITAHRFGLSGGIINIHPISHFHSLARLTTRRQFSTCFPMSGKLKVDTNYTLDAMMSELSPGT